MSGYYSWYPNEAKLVEQSTGGRWWSNSSNTAAEATYLYIAASAVTIAQDGSKNYGRTLR